MKGIVIAGGSSNGWISKGKMRGLAKLMLKIHPGMIGPQE